MNKYDVVIVNFNGEKIISRCLHSIFAASIKPAKVIIYDNASTDKSVEMIQKNFRQVILLKGKKNLGFGRANNEALKYSTSDYILFLNNDVVIDKKCPEYLLESFSKPDLAISCPAIFKGWDRRESQVYAFGASANQSGFAYGLFDKSPDRTDLCLFSGACFMARATVVKKNKFEKRFFLYYEELDLSAKILRAGKKIGRVARAKCYHLESYSSPGKDIASAIAFRQFYGVQNRWYSVGKFWPARLFPKALFYNYIHLAYMLYYFAKNKTPGYLRLSYLAPFNFLAGLKVRAGRDCKDRVWYKKLDKMNFTNCLKLGERVFDEKRYKLFNSN